MGVMESIFQYFPANIYAKQPLGKLKLRDLINSIRNPKLEIQNYFTLIRSTQDKKERDKLKEKLFMFTPSVFLDGVNRGYDNIVSFNEIAVIEWDNLSYERAIYLKHHVFSSFNSCISAFLSPSGKGVKFLFHIERPKSIEDYKSLWYGLAFHLEQIEPDIDACNERCTQVLYLSLDPEILVREETEAWRRRGAKIGAIEVKDFEVDPNYQRNEEDVKKVKLLVLNTINTITNSGHDIVKRISCLAGGYVASGYVTEEEITDFIYSLIDEHEYLRQKAETYKKTAKRFIKSGQNAPLKLK